jgi:hypothetical protein
VILSAVLDVSEHSAGEESTKEASATIITSTNNTENVSSRIPPTNANGEYSKTSGTLFIVFLVIAALVVLVLAAFLLRRRMGNGLCRPKSYHIENCGNVVIGGTMDNNVDVVSRH